MNAQNKISKVLASVTAALDPSTVTCNEGLGTVNKRAESPVSLKVTYDVPLRMPVMLKLAVVSVRVKVYELGVNVTTALSGVKVTLPTILS